MASEEEWKDNRLSQMDTGQFFSSGLRIPHHFVAKGLTIRVGEHNEASVCYDTSLCNVRAGWTGGFLKFDPRRYSIITTPTTTERARILGSPATAWNGEVQYRGLCLHTNRVVLSYSVDGVDVIESPWIESSSGATAFTRTIEMNATRRDLLLSTVELKQSQAATNLVDATRIVVLQNSSNCVAAAVFGTATLFAQDEQIMVRFPAAESNLAKILVWGGSPKHLLLFSNIVKVSTAAESIAHLRRPGSRRWGDAIITQGERAAASKDPYVLDTIAVPYDNRYHALMFLTGVDFLENGDAAVCTLHGDVWLVSGIDDNLQAVRWKRFATGLFQPLGLKVVRNQIYVLGRDQITLLHDANNDGEADFYENFCNKIKTSENGHDFVTALDTDTDGNFYYADPSGIHRVSADAKQLESIATGFRNPNGLGVGPNRVITVAPQEGNWTPSSAICEIKENGFYGFGGPQITSERPLGYDRPLCWIPRNIDNSTASQVWVASDRWGPLKDQMLSLSFGRCAMMLVLREMIDGVAQGGVITLKPHFLSGAMRGTFRKTDGQLYIVGSLGWSTSATRDGCFQRVRYTGNKTYLPIGLHVHQDGLRLEFTEPLERQTAEDPGSYGIEQWNYVYSQNYGSKEYSVRRPKEIGHDSVEVTKATLLADQRTVFLEIPNLQPVMQMEIQYNLDSADGKSIRGEIYNTINKLGPRFSDVLK